MTGRTLKVLPDEHQQRWLRVCEHAREAILDFVRRGVEPNNILVVVAPAQSHQAWALIEHYPEYVPFWGDGEDGAIVAVLGTTGVLEDPDVQDDPLLGYLARVPEGQFGLLIFAQEGRPVISTCVMPPGAAAENLSGGLNNCRSGS